MLPKAHHIVTYHKGFNDPMCAEVIDLSKSTFLPELIDMHGHLSFEPHGGNPIAYRVTHNDLDMALNATTYAKRTLEAGFTSARDVGASTEVIVALKRAINEGTIPGPRLWVAGGPLGPTGGPGDGRNGMSPALPSDHWVETVVDGPLDAREIGREAGGAAGVRTGK